MDTQNELNSEFEKRPRLKPKEPALWAKLLIGVFAALIASGLGVILPIVGMLTVFAVFLPVLLGLMVYGWGDWQGLGAYLLALEGCQLLIGGPIFGATMLLAVALPLAVMAYLDMRKLLFFKRMYASLAVQLMGMVLALGLIVLIYRENLGDLTAKALKSGFDQMSVAMKEMLASYYKRFYGAMGLELKYETADEMLAAVAETCGELVKISLPAMLIVIASINVLPGVRIYSGVRVKRGIPGETNEPVAKWRMKDQAVLGLILLIVTGIVLNATIAERGRVVLYTVETLALVACTVQTVASISDRMSKAPIGTGMKVAFCVLLILFFFQSIPFYGGLSMLIGSHGIITNWLRRRAANRPDNNDPF